MPEQITVTRSRRVLPELPKRKDTKKEARIDVWLFVAGIALATGYLLFF